MRSTAGRTATGSTAPGPIDSPLSTALLALHATMDAEAFWGASLGVLRTALPAFHYLLGMASVGAKPFLLRTTLPVPNEPDYWERLNRVAPLEKLIPRQVGKKVGRLSDSVPFFLLRLSPFYQNFMKPEGWRYSAAMFFWDGDQFLGHLAQNRTAAQGDYTDQEMRLLLDLHPHFETAVRRIIRFDRERAGRLSLEESVRRSPLPTALLDWDLNLIYHNAAGAEACAVWRLGRQAARAHKPAFVLPEDLAAACRALRREREATLLDGSRPRAAEAKEVDHPTLPQAQATVRRLEPSDSQFTWPSFLIHFSLLQLHDQPGAGVPVLGRLTPTEREVAIRAAEGFQNDEVAAQLGVSRNTVRAHLREIFRKLQIDGRGKLAPLLRGRAAQVDGTKSDVHAAD